MTCVTTAVRPLKRKCSDSATKMLEISAIDSFATLNLGDISSSAAPRKVSISADSTGMNSCAESSTGESRNNSCSSSSSGGGDDVFKLSPQPVVQQPVSSNSAKKRVGWWRSWRENEKAKDEKRKAIEVARRRLRTSSLRAEDEQKYAPSRSEKMDVSVTDVSKLVRVLCL